MKTRASKVKFLVVLGLRCGFLDSAMHPADDENDGHKPRHPSTAGGSEARIDLIARVHPAA